MSQEPKLITNPSPTLVQSMYLSAPHSRHEDPNYFPWCTDCWEQVDD